MLIKVERKATFLCVKSEAREIKNLLKVHSKSTMPPYLSGTQWPETGHRNGGQESGQKRRPA